MIHGVHDPFNLQRFIDAQRGIFDEALAELIAGAKQSHWMWFIFPQLAALGRSATAQFYGIASLDEAKAYAAHPLLGARLDECVRAVLPWASRRSPDQILGPVDALKFRSSLTLFDRAMPAAIFREALGAFYRGLPDERTLALLNAWD